MDRSRRATSGCRHQAKTLPASTPGPSTPLAGPPRAPRQPGPPALLRQAPVLTENSRGKLNLPTGCCFAWQHPRISNCETPKDNFFSSHPQQGFFFKIPKNCLDFFPPEKYSNSHPADGYLLENYYYLSNGQLICSVNYYPVWFVHI